MNPLCNALRAAGVSACVLAVAAMAHAGIIDDGANDADHINLANQSQYDSVGVVKLGGTAIDSSGILIAPNWVLTAAHTIPSGNAGATDTWTFGSEIRLIEDSFRNPNFNGQIANGYDIALHKLASPITTITPAQLYTGAASDLIGDTLTYVGYGQSGTGSTGATLPWGTKRAGVNIAEQLGYTINPGGVNEAVYTGQMLFADMDDPPGGPQFGNPLGSTIPINLEYLIALGDSGGGLFVEQGGQHYVAGVHSTIFDFDPQGTFGYGDIMGSTTIEQSLAWILGMITPAPIVGDLDADGFVGILDLNLILSNWNLTVTPGDLALGDPSNDGFVGIEDLNIVLGNWNAGTPPTLEQQVGLAPEPSTLALFSAAIGLMAGKRRPRS